MGFTEHARELSIDDINYMHDHLPVGEYFSVDPAGKGVWIHDAITGEPLAAGHVPQGIMQNPELAAGIAYLRSDAAKRVTVQFVLGAHGSGEDFRNILRAHGDVLRRSPWLALEMSWHSQHTNEGVLQPDSVTLEPADAAKYSGRHAFQAEELLWANDNQKKVMPCEIAIDNTSVLATELAHLWNDVYESTGSIEHIDQVVRDAAVRMAERAYQAMRQWTIVAQLGNWLMRLDKAGRLPAHTIELPLVIGSWHERSADRLTSLGVNAEIYRTPHKAFDAPQAARYRTLDMDAVYTGFASLELLNSRPQSG